MPRPTTGRNGVSPNFGTHEDAEPPSSLSYFERHGIVPPPLISRARRTRRRVQEAIADEPASQAAVVDDDAEPPSELEMIIQGAKDGEDASARLRRDLLGEDSYDKHSYPWDYIWYNQTSTPRTGVPVEMNINFHRVFEADVVNSVMDLVVWLRMVWVDPRLTWKPEEYGNLTYMWAWLGDGGAGGETSEIWTPDIELWNLETGIKDSFEDTYARVTNDGRVWWSRPGHLRPTCKYYGLDAFPFDRLTCPMEFGSWMRSGEYINVVQMGGTGYSLGGSETAGESFEEYSFAEEDPITCKRHTYTYESAPEDDWPVLLYNVTLERSWQPYARGYVTIQIVLNIIGFSAFWLPPSCGERMSLSITAVLAALAAEIVVAASLPACSELTWFAKFSLLSMTFAFISLTESVVVLYFYYKRKDDMVPRWYTFTKNWYLVRQAKRRGEDLKKSGTEMAARTTTLVAETTNTAIDSITAGVKGMQKRLSQDHGSDDDDFDEGKDDAANGGHATSEESKNNAPSTPSVRFPDEKDNGGRRRLPRLDSVAMPRDANDFLNDAELESNAKWKKVAARVDDVARFWIPLAYIISLSIVLAQVL